jgi:hypothetical protein
MKSSTEGTDVPKSVQSDAYQISGRRSRSLTRSSQIRLRRISATRRRWSSTTRRTRPG